MTAPAIIPTKGEAIRVQPGQVRACPLPTPREQGDGSCMNVTTHADRIDPRCKQPPLTDDDMIALWRAGDALAQIANAAKRRNGLTRVEVRAIVLGDRDAVTIGEAANGVLARMKVTA